MTATQTSAATHERPITYRHVGPLLPPEEAIRQSFNSIDPQNYAFAFGALSAHYGWAWAKLQEQAEELERLKVKQPTCGYCGTKLTPVDCEVKYPVIRGDEVRQEHIEQPYYCPECQAGAEDES